MYGPGWGPARWPARATPNFKGGAASGVLAVWVLFHPDIAGALDAWLKANGRAYGLATKGHAYLNSEETAQLGVQYGDKVVVVEQHAGEMVYAPPGWVHQVTNVQP